MNKFAKGSLAAGAGIVLLMGGVGTLAYWNDEVGIQGGTVQAGSLDLDAAPGTWAPEITSWVPGDEATYTTTLQLTVEGDNIQGTVALDRDSLEFKNAKGEVIPELADEFDIEFAPVEGSLPASQVVTYDEKTETFSFDGAGAYAIPVEVTVAFPFETENDDPNQSQNTSVDLDKLSFTATQTLAK